VVIYRSGGSTLEQYLSGAPSNSRSGGETSGSLAPLLRRIEEVACDVRSSQASMESMASRLDSFETAMGAAHAATSHVSAGVLALQHDMQTLAAHLGIVVSVPVPKPVPRQRKTRRATSALLHDPLAAGSPGAGTSRADVASTAVTPPSERPSASRKQVLLEAARWLDATSSAQESMPPQEGDERGQEGLLEALTDLDDGMPLV
jgi:hypothetical protein